MCHRYAVGLSADISTASAFLIAPRFVLTVYQIFLVIGEESLNISPIIFRQNAQKGDGSSVSFPYAGYRLLMRSSSGNARVNTLIAQEYMAFLEQNIRIKQLAVSARGPMTARFLPIYWANSPVDCRLIPTCSGRCV